ncbi:hypothetical protein [Halobacillus massiliensis]|uniref:hypothetical protein n=1 Tax=Halobacillus massiliensis TaxID=1926286 RepID=UPI0009E44CF8|nr:hypothetical protein [Halobacillus massiliensis]
MSQIFSDYFNDTVLSLPENFIDVKTGETFVVSPKVIEELKYHSENNTLKHLIISALHEYFHGVPVQNGGSNELLSELLAIKQLLNSGNRSSFQVPASSAPTHGSSQKLNMKEIEDVLDAFLG